MALLSLFMIGCGQQQPQAQPQDSPAEQTVYRIIDNLDDATIETVLTKGNFDKLRKGMTFNEVVGSLNVKIPASKPNDRHCVAIWQGKGKNITVYFADGKVTKITQTGID
jgi:hypothetical protein